MNAKRSRKGGGLMLLTCRQRVARAEVALRELDLSVTTQADKVRIDRIRQGMRALDDEQCQTKDTVANLIDSLVSGYTEPEVIEDLRELVTSWDKAAKQLARRARKWVARAG
jgi:hypothetical protein